MSDVHAHHRARSLLDWCRGEEGKAKGDGAKDEVQEANGVRIIDVTKVCKHSDSGGEIFCDLRGSSSSLRVHM